MESGGQHYLFSTTHYFLPISQQGDPGDFLQQSWVAGQVVRIYADAGPISLEAV